MDAAFCEAEAGHDFVKDDEGAVLGGDVSDGLEIAWAGEDESGIGGVGFDDDGGDVLAVLGEGFF